MKTEDLPLVPILHPFKQCGSTGKRSGLPCKQPAMKNGRCRLHGGKSTGAKTPQGKAEQRLGNFKHGCYSQETKEEWQLIKQLFQDSKHTIEAVRGGG